MSEYAIEMLGITKRFPGIIANDNITLQLKKGEIHALLGENGAGKSTLMSVLFGLYQPEEGEIHKDGKKVEIKDPNDANDQIRKSDRLDRSKSRDLQICRCLQRQILLLYTIQQNRILERSMQIL
mgnify:CR=1 FL=1